MLEWECRPCCSTPLRALLSTYRAKEFYYVHCTLVEESAANDRNHLGVIESPLRMQMQMNYEHTRSFFLPERQSSNSDAFPWGPGEPAPF